MGERPRKSKSVANRTPTCPQPGFVYDCRHLNRSPHTLQRPDRQQEVYLLDESGDFRSHGTLSQALLDALGRVVALPE